MERSKTVVSETDIACNVFPSPSHRDKAQLNTMFSYLYIFFLKLSKTYGDDETALLWLCHTFKQGKRISVY